MAAYYRFKLRFQQFQVQNMAAIVIDYAGTLRPTGRRILETVPWPPRRPARAPPCARRQCPTTIPSPGSSLALQTSTGRPGAPRHRDSPGIHRGIHAASAAHTLLESHIRCPGINSRLNRQRACICERPVFSFCTARAVSLASSWVIRRRARGAAAARAVPEVQNPAPLPAVVLRKRSGLGRFPTQ